MWVLQSAKYLQVHYPSQLWGWELLAQCALRKLKVRGTEEDSDVQHWIRLSIDSLIDANLRLGSRLPLWFKPWVWMRSPGRMWSRRPKSKTWTILMHKGHADEDEPAKNCQKEHPATSEGNQENTEIQKPRQDQEKGPVNSLSVQRSQVRPRLEEDTGFVGAVAVAVWQCTTQISLPERTWPREEFFSFFFF